MKTITRLVLGLVSSLFLAAGFARAAENLDPMTKSLGVTENNTISRTATNCASNFCNLVGEDE